MLLGYIENLKALKLDLKTQPKNQKTVLGISNFHNFPTAMASDGTCISEVLMSKLDRKTRKQMTLISKIPFTDLKIYPSCLKLSKILLEW